MKIDVVLHFHAGMAGFFEDCVAGAARVDFRSDVGNRSEHGDMGEGYDNIKMCEDAGQGLEDGAI